MKTREQFGSYLLLKKLTEDPFGETFRAGRIGRSGLERVVLLRVFNGPGIDGQAFSQKLKARKNVHEVLRSPNIGDGVDLGDVHGIPYVAWDYVSGKTLASFFHQATRTGTPIPNDHALLVTERIALACAVGYETRIDDKRLAHGCLVPELVLLSNEGETRLLGFEAAPMLRQLAVSGPAANHFAPYMSPEARAGQPVGKSDDVFSLGVILYELLTGQRLPLSSNYEAAIASATLGIDDSPVADELKALLRKSLTTVDQRVVDVVTWHKALSKAMFEGQYNPTTFNLAFFMHNLFRDEIERETHEIEAEKSIEVPRLPPPAAVAPTAAPTSSGPVREDTLAVRDRYGFEETTKKSGMSPALLGGLVAALVVAGVGGYIMFGKKAPAPAPVEPVTQPAPVAPAGPTPAEIQAQIEMLVAEQTKALEEGLRQQQDTKIKALEEQLKTAQENQRLAAERAAIERENQSRQPAVPETKAPAPETKAAPEPTKAEPVVETKAPETKAAVPTPAPVETKAAPPVATKPAAPVATPRPTAAPSVRTGDLVTPGAGITNPKLTRQPVTRFPETARRMNQRQATVRVRVLVDETGKVIDAQLSGPEDRYGFGREALRAAATAEFEPAKTADGVRVKMWYEFAIAFKG